MSNIARWPAVIVRRSADIGLAVHAHSSKHDGDWANRNALSRATSNSESLRNTSTSEANWCIYRGHGHVSILESMLIFSQISVAMSGAVAPTKKKGGVDRFTLDDERPFDSYIAKYEAEKQRKNKTALQAELHGQGTATPVQTKKPTRKKSRVSKPIELYPHNVDHASALCLDSK
jgi:hypothetical protein